MNTQEILLIWTIAATFIGPILAVAITLWHQDRSLRNRSRLELFSIMMRHRRNALSAEFVGALNMVPVHFNKNQTVLERYATLMSTFEDNGWHNPQAIPALNDKVDTNIAYLLSEMSKAVRTPIEQLQILKGAYSPRGWADDQQRQRQQQEAVIQLLVGQTGLNVIVHQSHASKPEPLKPMDEQNIDGQLLEPTPATPLGSIAREDSKGEQPASEQTALI